MSFTIVEQTTPRVNRSELAVPGSSPKFFEKAATGDADVVFLDLEDAVAPDDKPQARRNVIEAINDIDWGNKTLSVRINGPNVYPAIILITNGHNDQLVYFSYYCKLQLYT